MLLEMMSGNQLPERVLKVIEIGSAYCEPDIETALPSGGRICDHTIDAFVSRESAPVNPVQETRGAGAIDRGELISFDAVRNELHAGGKLSEFHEVGFA